MGELKVQPWYDKNMLYNISSDPPAHLIRAFTNCMTSKYISVFTYDKKQWPLPVFRDANADLPPKTGFLVVGLYLDFHYLIF